MADKTTQIKHTEVRARLGDLHISPRKVRIVTDLLRKKSVEGARTQLQFLSKKSVTPILKLINSAVANAQHNFKLDPAELVIKSITVNQGTVMKRYKPRAQGRATPIRRRTSIVELILIVDPKAAKLKGPKSAVASVAAAQKLKPEQEIEKEEKEARAKTTDKEVKHAPKAESSGKLKEQATAKKRTLFNRKTNA